jgi:hypothetical protein
MTNHCNYVTKMLVRASLVIALSTELVTSIALASSPGGGWKGHQATIQAPSTSRRAKFSRPPQLGVNVTASSGRRVSADAKIIKGQEQALWVTLSRCGRCNYVTNALKPCDERPGNLSG